MKEPSCYNKNQCKTFQTQKPYPNPQNKKRDFKCISAYTFHRMKKKLTCPPTPAKRRGKGEKRLSEAIRREAMESPDTSPATRKTLSSPSLAAMSIGALEEENKNHCTHRIFGFGFGFHFLLNKAFAPNEIGGIQLQSMMRSAG